jgi:CubicO group peptidase (beta-lactamase class C family)
VVLAALTGVVVQAAAPADAWGRVAALYEQRLQQAGIVGSSLLFVKDGLIAHTAFEGYHDRASKRQTDADTIYHWASITKTLTGVAIMQLRDRGLLSLDDPAVKYVPELREVHNPYGDISQVTIRHLMMHSAGFRAGTWPWGGDQPWHPFEPTRWAQVVAMMPYTELQFQPGTSYSYSNPGVIFLGRIIELFSGDDYEIYINKNIFMPLGMSRSFFDRAPYFLAGNRSHSYEADDDGIREQRFDFDSGITVSNGGLNAPIGDMANWLTFLIDGNETILKRSSLEEMSKPQIRAKDGEGGSGDQNGFISRLYVHRPSRSGYVVSFNTDVTSKRDPRHTTRAVDNDLRDTIVRELFVPLAPR